MMADSAKTSPRPFFSERKPASGHPTDDEDPGESPGEKEKVPMMRTWQVPAVVLLLATALLARPAGAIPGDPGAPPPPATFDNGVRTPGPDVAPPPAPDNAAAADSTAPAAVDNAAAPAPGAPDVSAPGEETAGEAPPPAIADPLEPVNRALFAFNDKAYFWVLKPVAKGYQAVVPEGARVSVRNFFSNLGTPIRLANNALQGKLKGAGTELLRFVINSTIGMAGFFDPARTGFHIEKRDEDLGQTFGRYGLGQGFYIVWPLLGPSSARDTAGSVGDLFLDPLTYIKDPWAEAGVRTYKGENELSLTIGDYEDLKRSALDPYVAVRDAYVQNRAKKVGE